MKFRNGFVSNSSSSSFIIQWKCNLPEVTDSIEKSVGWLFDVPAFECSEEVKPKQMTLFDDEECPVYKPDDQIQSLLEDICQKTKRIGKSEGMFESTFLTSMRNEVMDYGNSAMSLLMALTVDDIENGKRRFEIIHVRTEDGGWG
jgi:hypothetical protein